MRPNVLRRLVSGAPRLLLMKKCVLVKCGWTMCLQLWWILLGLCEMTPVMLTKCLARWFLVLRMVKNPRPVLTALMRVLRGMCRNLCLKSYATVVGYLISVPILLRPVRATCVWLFIVFVVVLILVWTVVWCLLGLISIPVVCSVLMQLLVSVTLIV